MKTKFLLFITSMLTCIITTEAKTYYVSAAGSNTNTGLSATSPWQTIAKVNSSFSGMASGDTILFRRGDTFYGTLIIGKTGVSGKPMVIDAYGTGEKPILTGFVTPTAWTLVGNGIYQAAIPNAKATLNMVTLNNLPQALGRYPNATDPLGGFLTYESTSSNTITDNQLTSTTNWTGAEVVIRKNLWLLDRCKVTAHSGSKITYSNTNSSTLGCTGGFGYFFQNDVRTLDRLGEWYLDYAARNLKMFFGSASPSDFTIKVSTLDTLLAIGSKSYINISNIVFDGANDNSVSITSGNYISIKDCDFTNSGNRAVKMHSVTNILMEGCTTNYSLTNAMYMYTGTNSNVTIRNCMIRNTGIIAGMGMSNGDGYKGLLINSNNLLMEYNRIDTTGYVALQFQGNNVNIRYNVVNYYAIVKEDGGGIYTYVGGTDAAPGDTYTNRTISNNIVMNGMGAPAGKPAGQMQYVTGVYLDGRTMNVNVLNNTAFNIGKNGFHTNNASSVTFKNNTSYNNLNAMSIMRWDWGSIKNLTVKNNIFYPKYETQRTIYYTNAALYSPDSISINQALKAMGNVDSNTYNMINPTPFNFELYASAGGPAVPATPYSLEAWKAGSTHDVKGQKTAKSPVANSKPVLIGANKFSNSNFNTNITGFTLFGTSVTTAWDNTNKIDGGSLRVNFTAPSANKYITLHSPMGQIDSTKQYVLRFSLYGTTSQGIVKAFIRKSSSPFNNLVPTQTHTFVTGRSEHEFLFNAPIADLGGSIVIQLEQYSGTTYIDNVEFFEASAVMHDVQSQVRFEYNDTKNTRTVMLDTHYTDVTGTVHKDSVSLQPFSSVILIKDTGAIVAKPQPELALTANSSSADISCFGDSTQVTVGATGGKAPYTGTGIYTVKAGRGSVALSAKIPTAGRYTALYYTIGAIDSSKNYVLKFSTTRSVDSANIKVSIRQSRSPFATITAKQLAVINTSRVDHEYYFTGTPTEAAASFQIEIEQTAGVTNIDNIAFFEADTSKKPISTNRYAYGQFENNISYLFAYSGSTTNHNIAWDSTSKISAIYYYLVTDTAGAISVAEVKTTQPVAALKATAIAGAITVLDGITTVNVAATGGTAPYQGTGDFSAGVGTYTYTVTDAKGCTATATVAVNLTLAKTSATSTTNAKTHNNLTETGKELRLSASPNPSNTSFNVVAEGGSNEKLMLVAYTADGRIAYQATGNSKSRFNFGNSFVPGVYFVKVAQGNTVKTLKLVKAGR